MANEEKILAMLDKMQSDIELIKKHIGANIFNCFDKNLKIHAFDFLNNTILQLSRNLFKTSHPKPLR